MVEFRAEKPECGICCAPPTFRYSMPEGTVLLTSQDVATGKVMQLRSAGAFGLCDACRKIAQGSALPAVVARRLSHRVTEVHPSFKPLTPEQRQVARKAAEKLYEKIIPLLSDEKPFVDDGKDPFDRMSAWFDEPKPTPPSSN